MKTKLIAFISLTMACWVNAATPLGTAFNYQGRLNTAAGAANGFYDFRFALYDAANGVTPVSSVVEVSAVAVSNGLFTVSLDFGDGVFAGDERWLQISVRTNGVGGFAELAPRQGLAATPYALFTPDAGTAATALNVASNTVTTASLVNSNITAAKIASGQVVKSLNGLSDAVTLTAGTNINMTSDGNGWRISAVPGTVVTNGGWGLSGNPNTTSSNFVGTTDGRPLELRVSGARALMLVPTTDTPNLIGGYSGNSIGSGIAGATIGGGGTVLGTQPNVIAFNGQYGTIAGGYHNAVTNYGGAILGGSVHLAGGWLSGVGAGQGHTNLGDYGWIGGGQNNTVYASSGVSAIGGGYRNRIAPGAAASSIGGGQNNFIGTNATWSTIAGGTGGAIGTAATGSTISGGADHRIGASANFAVVGGGTGNIIGDVAERATISGGEANTVERYAASAVISGGWVNVVRDHAHEAVVAGGLDNQVGSGAFVGTIGGGTHNRVNAPGATVPGGNGNEANGTNSFAVGTQAHAANNGSFVWADYNYSDFVSTGVNQFLVRAGGGVGVNLNAPQQDLSVNGGMNIDQASLNVGTATNILSFGSASGEGIGSKRSGINRFGLDFYTGFAQRMTIANNGYVGIGTNTPVSPLHVNGEATFKVLTIVGGADVAEPFEIVTPDTPKGAVVVIDPKQPGKLRLSERAYDTRVAGVVSGANGVQPGLSLRQEGAMPGGRNVALTGRVYVQADATSGAIEPGDLLTTSATPGHAMTVIDHARAQGAILGKAMTGLEEGKGLVLVLVTLQ